MKRRNFSLAMAALLAGAAGAQAQPPPGGGGRGKGRGSGGPGGPGGPRGGGPGGRGGETAPADFFASQLKGKDEAEQRVYDVVQKQLAQRGISVPLDDGRMLRMLAEFGNARKIVEIGCYHGVSAMFFCLAARATGGHLTTHDIDPEAIKIAKANFKAAGVEDLVTVVEGDAHEKVKEIEGPIDLLFQDADKPGYLDYLEKLLPKIRPGGLIVSHNMTVRQSDPKYIKRITEDPALETLLITIASGGISVTLKKH